MRYHCKVLNEKGEVIFDSSFDRVNIAVTEPFKGFIYEISANTYGQSIALSKKLEKYEIITYCRSEK